MMSSPASEAIVTTNKRRILNENENQPELAQDKFVSPESSKSPWIYQFGLVYKDEVEIDLIYFRCCVETFCKIVKIRRGSMGDVYRHLSSHQIKNNNKNYQSQIQKHQANSELQSSSYDALAQQRNVSVPRYCDLIRALFTIRRMLAFNFFEDDAVRELTPGIRHISNKGIKSLLLEYYLSFLKFIS